jgi:hypothetical protein
MENGKAIMTCQAAKLFACKWEQPVLGQLAQHYLISRGYVGTSFIAAALS